VAEADRAAFASGVVHDVYGTAALVRDMEYAARLVLLPLLEPGEEGVGAEVWCRHRAPAPVGAAVDLTATATEQTRRRLVCRVEARHDGRLIGEGTVTQVIVDPARFGGRPAGAGSPDTRRGGVTRQGSSLMVKLVAMFSRPEDPAAFDRAYFGTHLELNAKTPGLRRTEVARVTGAPRGETPWYLVTEMYYDDEASMRAAFASPEAAEAGRQLMSFAKGLVTMYTAEVVDGAGKPA